MREQHRNKNFIQAGKGILQVLAVLFLLGALVKLCNFLVVDDADSYTRLTLHELYICQEPVETIFLGSSHCFRAYDPTLYQELTGESALNLGSSSQNYDTSYYLLREAVSCQPVKTLYLDMYWAFLYSQRDGRDLVQANIISDYMRPSLNKLDFVLHMSSSEHYTNTVFPFRRNWRLLGDLSYIRENVRKKQTEAYRAYEPVINEEEYYAGRGFVYSTTELKPEEITWWEKFGKIDLSGDDTFICSYLDRIAALCQEQGIELIFVTAPSYYQYLDVVGPYDPAHERILELAEKYGVPYLDFNLCKEEYLGLSAADYMDVDHLNGAGAEKLTKTLAELRNDPSLIDEYFVSCYDVR